MLNSILATEENKCSYRVTPLGRISEANIAKLVASVARYSNLPKLSPKQLFRLNQAKEILTRMFPNE